MQHLNTAGRWFGAAILTGYVLDIGSNFFLQDRIRIGEGAMGLFGGAASQPGLIGAIALIGMVSGLVSLAAAALLCQLSLSRSFAWLAFLILGIKAVSFAIGGSEIASFQMYRGIGEAIANAPAGEVARLAEPLRVLLSELRNGLHFPGFMLGGVSAFAVYLLLLKSRWVPRWLALAGLAATASQITGVFTGVLGAEVSFLFLAPLALVQLLLGLWLLAKGFAEPDARSAG